MGGVSRLPLRVRLVAAFVLVMMGLLAGAGSLVFWRVQVALDNTLNADLNAQVVTTREAWRAHPGESRRVIASLPPEALGQLLDASGRMLAATPAASGAILLPTADLPVAAAGRVDLHPGNVLTGGNKRLHVIALPLTRDAGREPVIAAIAVRLGQRDEALRELLGQLALANLAALAFASAVGYRLARAALQPVERYRTRAEQIAAGATGLRLDVPVDVDDEISRLGHTLNRMLTTQERAAQQQRQFLADASHELRAPLTILTSEVELALRRPRTAPEYEATLQQVAHDAARLVVLANQLLDLEQALTATPTPDAVGQETHVAAAVQRAVERARGHLLDTGRHVTASVTGTAKVGLSELALDQALGNLAENAAVHGAGDVTILAAEAEGGVVVEVTVHDQGQGLEAAFIPHAVERFRRLDTARTTSGSGLGLALVHTVISRYGGELRLCANGTHHRYPPLRFDDMPCAHEENGTTATVLLPLPAATSSASRTPFAGRSRSMVEGSREAPADG